MSDFLRANGVAPALGLIGILLLPCVVGCDLDPTQSPIDPAGYVGFFRHRDDHFGHSVAVDRKALLVGVPNAIVVHYVDTVRVDERSGLAMVYGIPIEWDPNLPNIIRNKYRLQPEQPGFFGYAGCGTSVAIEGDWAIIGCPYFDFDRGTGTVVHEAGGVLIFRRWPDTEDFWYPEPVFIVNSASQSGDHLGYAVAIKGGRVVVGVPGRNTGGFVGVLEYDEPNDAWIANRYPVFDAPVPGPGDLFGLSVDIDEIDGNTIAVGSPGNDFAYIYTLEPGPDGPTWEHHRGVFGPLQSHFGWSVSVAGDYLAVGAPREDYRDQTGGLASVDGGGVWIFNRTKPWYIGGPIGDWGFEEHLTSAEGDEIPESFALFGYSVALTIWNDNPWLVVGAPLKGPADAGEADVFLGFLGMWFRREVLTATDPQNLAGFGFSVAVTWNNQGVNAAVGAPFHDYVGDPNDPDDDVENAGYVELFEEVEEM